MPTLTLKFKDSLIKTYSIKRGETFNIGRREINQIVIANLTVSGVHARIDSTDDGYLLTDLQSKNGLFVNEDTFTAGYLNDGDVISIGKHTIAFSLDDGDVTEQIKNGSGMDDTMVMNDFSAKNIVNELAAAKIKKRVGLLRFIEGGDGTIELSKRMVKIGKAASNDIIIYGFMLGKTVATISDTPQGHVVTPSGGFAKIKINNQSIRNPRVLEEFDSIKIGTVELQFYYK